MTASSPNWQQGYVATAAEWNALWGGKQDAIVLTAEEIAAPTPEIIADLDAIFRLDVEPYTRYMSNGSALIPSVDGGSFLPLSGGTITGQLSQSINRTWSGGYPNGNVGEYFDQTFTGTPTGHYADPSGGAWVPFNFRSIKDTLAFDIPASSVFGNLIRHEAGGSGATGGRVALAIDYQNTGPMATVNQNDFYSCLQLSTYASYNITGSTALSPKGNFYGWNVYTSAKAAAADATPIFVAGLAGTEMDYTIEAGGSVHSGVGILIVNFSPVGTTEIDNGAAIVLSSSHTGNAGFKDWGLFFGNKNVGDTLPVIQAGSLIGSQTGTVVNGIDFSNTTFTGSFLKGPNGFSVAGNNTVHTDTIRGASAAAVHFTTPNGDGLFNMALIGPGPPVNELTALAASTGLNPRVGVLGSDTDVWLELCGGGASGAIGGVVLSTGVLAHIASFNGVANALSGFNFNQAASGGNVQIDVAGTPTRIHLGASAATGVILGNSTGTLGVYGATGVVKQTGVAVTAAAIHAALTNLGLIAP